MHGYLNYGAMYRNRECHMGSHTFRTFMINIHDEGNLFNPIRLKYFDFKIY